MCDFPYPENTPGSDFKNNGGKYLRNLSEENKATLTEIQAWVESEKISLSDLSLDILDNDLLLLRYLRANNFNVKKTKKHMLTNIEWRKAQNIPELMMQSPEEILGCRLADLVGYFPHWHSGYDKTGRPLLFKQQGAFDIKEIKALAGGNFDRIIRYHVWEQELASRLCYEASLRTRTIIETVTVVLDVKGLSLMSMTSDFRTMMNGIVQMDQDMYPETLGKILIVNAPFIFPSIWGFVKPWLDPITAAKVNIKGVDYKDLLSENVGLENLPSNYFGALPPLHNEVHPYVEGMAILTTSTKSGKEAFDAMTETLQTLAVTDQEQDQNQDQNQEQGQPAENVFNFGHCHTEEGGEVEVKAVGETQPNTPLSVAAAPSLA